MQKFKDATKKYPGVGSSTSSDEEEEAREKVRDKYRKMLPEKDMDTGIMVSLKLNATKRDFNFPDHVTFRDLRNAARSILGKEKAPFDLHFIKKDDGRMKADGESNVKSTVMRIDTGIDDAEKLEDWIKNRSVVIIIPT